MKLKINKERLERNLYELGKIGRNEHGGIDRALGSKEDLLAREWLRAYWEDKMGLKVRHDAIANMWVLYDSKLQENTTGKPSGNTNENTKEGSSGEYQPLPPIVIGSHHDAVPDGGMYDGFLAAGEFALGYEKIIKEEHRDDVVGTIGYVKVLPNAASIIPGSVELILELRCCSEIVNRQLNIIGVNVYHRSDMEEAAELLSDSAYNFETVITNEFLPEKCKEAFALLNSGDKNAEKVVFTFA